MEGAAEGLEVTICEIRAIFPHSVYTEASFFRDHISELLDKVGNDETYKDVNNVRDARLKASLEALESILDLLRPKEAEQVLSLNELEEQVKLYFLC